MSRGIDRVLCIASLAVAVLALVAVFRWTGAHPYPIWFDEANYFNYVIDDHVAYQRGGVVAMAKSLVFLDNVRPPGYRAVVAPIAALTLPSLSLLRTIAITVTLAAIVVVAFTCRRFASWPSSLIAAATLLAMPEVLGSGGWFGTEYVLFFAVALLLFGLTRRSFLAVAAAVALGLLAKASFFLIGGPVILYAIRRTPRLFFAAALGALLAAGWWMWDPGAAISFAQYGRTFPRAALDAPLALGALVAKMNVLSVAIGIVLLIALAVLFILTLRRPLTPEMREALLLAAFVIVPTLGLAFLSPVFVARHFVATLFALALPLAVLLDRSSTWLRVAFTVAVLAQSAWIAAQPFHFLPPVEQTDWSQLRAIIRKPNPHITFLGGWPSLSEPEIRYGWLRDGQPARVQPLWRADGPPIDWPKTMERVLASDAVLVIPPSAPARLTAGNQRWERADNRHNAELIAQLERSGAFAPPVPFRIGEGVRVEGWVYLRRSYH